uniref:Uncharacterized protein n=1 Tax=viral metagenome TaxID=1070528 RepID=A0A6C0ILJ1_9ZZZZ
MALFIMFVNAKTYNIVYNKVVPLQEYILEDKIREEIKEYIDTAQTEFKTFSLYKTYKDIIHFSINKYDSVADGLKGEYNDFYEYKHSECTEENNTKFLISPNEEKLRAFCGYINRLTHW